MWSNKEFEIYCSVQQCSPCMEYIFNDSDKPIYRTTFRLGISVGIICGSKGPGGEQNSVLYLEKGMS